MAIPEEHLQLLLAINQKLKEVAWFVHYRYIKLSLGTDYEADDIFQDMWERILLAKEYPPATEKDLYLWARRLMTNKCINNMRSFLRTKERDNNYYLDVLPESDPEQAATQVKEVLARGRKLLSPKVMQVVEYRAAGVDDKEIAAAIGLNPITVRTRFFVGKNVLCKLRYNWQD